MGAAKRHKILAATAGAFVVGYGWPVAAAGGAVKGAEARAKRSYEKAVEEFVRKFALNFLHHVASVKLCI